MEILTKEIMGYPKYTINTNGEIFNKHTGRKMKARLDNGYLRIQLTVDKNHKFMTVHRILATHFLENLENYEVVDHKDRNKLNNSLENLRWTTHSENSRNQSVKNKFGVHNIFNIKIRNYEYYTVQITDNNKKQIRKYFPYNEEGLMLAKNWRIQKQIEFGGYINNQLS